MLDFSRSIARRISVFRSSAFLLAAAVLLVAAGRVVAAEAPGIREPAAAGGYYPAGPGPLKEQVDRFLDEDQAAPAPALSVRALVVPHAPYAVAGPMYGRAFVLVPDDTKRVVVLAPWHPRFEHLPEDRAAMRGIGSIPRKRAYRTPLGDVALDPAAKALREKYDCFGWVEAAHFWEPSIEVQLPFLQRRLSSFTLIPILLDATADPAPIAEALEPLLDDPDTILVVSAESAHVPAGTAVGRQWADHAAAGNAAALADDPCCGGPGLRVLLRLAADLHWKGDVLAFHAYENKGLAGGAAALVFTAAPAREQRTETLLQAAAAADWHDPATREAFHEALRASQRANFQGDLLSSGERFLLLDIARRSIVNTLRKEKLPALPLYSESLMRKYGCFVTLEKDGRLRGCIGNLLAKDPLVAAVRDNALRAAFKDRRFKPVTLEEMPAITIEISVLTDPKVVTFRDAADLLRQLVPGKHGVVIVSGKRRATYLPQVWSQIPDKEAFLSHLCRKGWLPADAWRDPTRVRVLTYEVFAFREERPRP